MDGGGHQYFQIDDVLRGDGFSITYEGARCEVWPHRAVNFRAELRKIYARVLRATECEPSRWIHRILSRPH